MSYQNGNSSNGNDTYQPIESSSVKDGRSHFSMKKLGVASVMVAFVAMFGVGLMPSAKLKSGVASREIAANGKMKLFDEFHRYVLEDYDAKPTFSSFLPGVAGLYGKPVWSFYVNRGQGVASFGSKTKEYPILEFNAANKAYQLTSFVGFRTFLQAVRGGKTIDYEPFNPKAARNLDSDDTDAEEEKPKRIMYVGPNEFEVKEINADIGLNTEVKYVVLPEEKFAALVRRVTFTNTGSSALSLSALDGLAQMEPVGGKLDWGLKQMGRTLEGWFGVYHADDTLTMPFYRMSTEPTDDAAVKIEEAGHYCISFIEDDENDAKLLPIVYDTSKVFGQSTSLDEAQGLKISTVSDLVSGPQFGDAKTSSAFAALDSFDLASGASVTITSFYGRASHVDEVPKIASTVSKAGYASAKFERARSLINELTAGVETNTTSTLFDGAIKQMYLDNSLRGGMPHILGDVDEKARMSNFDEDERVKVFHAFSRIHGDLERDYNAFSIDDTYFSQGPGNYRDVAQNRREDVTLTPRIGAFNIKMFLSYIQADGYEPLTVEAVVYMMTDEEEVETIASAVTSDTNSSDTLVDILTGGPFRPGQLFGLIEELNVTLSVDNESFLDQVVSVAENVPMAVYGSGYWADHWEYYLDLIDTYLAIYPDGEETLMYDNELRYFFSTATVKPRSEKYVLSLNFDGTGHHVQQLDSTFFDDEKAAEQEAFRNVNTGLIGIDAYWERTEEGSAFKSSPIAKLFLLGTIKFSTRDAYGMGIEYEGGRPGWNDAMNGLSGMVGSGMPETYETYLLLKYVKNVVDKYERPVIIPDELYKMVTSVNEALEKLEESGYEDPEDLPYDVPKELFEYWDVVASARENYRNDVQYYFSGNTTSIESDEMSDMLDSWIDQVELGMARAMKFGSHGYEDDGTSGIPPSYFSFEVTQYTKNKQKTEKGLPLVNARAMKVGRFPLFLEGPVRQMKTIADSKEDMSDLYQKVYASGLRDEKLKMYFLSASLEGQSYDMGRMMAFAAGWLENQSIWMHMSYKYYLQLIRGELFEEFFFEMRGGGMLPYMNPDVYGRSLMECSSFIASSAFPDPETQGRGFSARLSGSTAEFLSIWKLMFVGPEPFFLDENGDLKMQLVPALAEFFFNDQESGTPPFFDEDGQYTVSFKLFSAIKVTYHNPDGSNLFRVKPNGYKITMDDDSVVKIDGPEINTSIAKKIRKVYGVSSIDVYF